MAREQKVREYIFRLHRSGRPWDKRADEVDWNATAVGEPVRFNAVQSGMTWYAAGPVIVKAPESLADAGWTVLSRPGEVPIFVGKVGRPLVAGEDFALPVTDAVIGGVFS